MTMCCTSSSPTGVSWIGVPSEINIQKEHQPQPLRQPNLRSTHETGVGYGAAPVIEPPRAGTSGDVEYLLLSLQTYLDEFGTTFQNFMLDQTRGQQSQINAILQKNLDNFNNWILQVEKQRAAQSKSSIFGWISKIVKVVVAGCALAAAVATGPTPVGIAIGVTAFLALGTSMTDLVCNAPGVGPNPLDSWGVGGKLLRLDIPGLMAEAAKACGGDENWQLAFSIFGTVLQVVAAVYLASKFAPDALQTFLKAEAIGMGISGSMAISQGVITLEEVIPALERAGALSLGMLEQEAQMEELRKLIEYSREFILEMAKCEELLIENCRHALSAWVDSMMPSQSASARRGPVMA